MESDQLAASENPTESGTVTGTTSNQVRSYECTFCKRGFLNAQALGGHMNIHRKDKAKFKQPNSNFLIRNVQPSLDEQNQKSFPFWPHPTEEKAAAGEEIRSNAPKWPLWNMSKQDDTYSRDESETDMADVRQLPLFADTPSAEIQKPGEIQVRREAVEKNLPSDQARSSELDLELRLGPDPQDSPAVTGTRKFY